MAEKYDYETLLNMLHEHDHLTEHDDSCLACQEIISYGKELYKQGGGFTAKGISVEERNSRLKTLVAQGYSLYAISEKLGYSQGYLKRLLKKLDITLKENVEQKTKVLKMKDGKIIKEYKNAVEAAKELDISNADIYSVMNGNQKSAGGFEWKKIKV